MSSLTNAMKSQKTHRERHQPQERQQLGLLEKKKDYRQRARDYNEKKKTLKALRRKALNKNPDEFYFHMINSQLVDGVHREKAKDSDLTPEQAKLMQTRDLSYIIHKRTIEKKKIDKLKANLHMLDVEEKPLNKHTFFVDSVEEKRSFDPAVRLETAPELLGRAFNRPRVSDLSSSSVSTALSETEDLAKLRKKAYRELEQRIERERQLGVVQAKMEVRRQLQSKKDKPLSVLKQETKEAAPVLRWPSERKK
jgi:U3 small nucleolar RNA-associated protein 11